MEEQIKELTVEEIQTQIQAQKKAQSALQEKLAKLQSERVQVQIDALSAAARKRKEDEDKEAEVLAELARKRALRAAEAAAAEQVALDARRKVTIEQQEANQRAAIERQKLEKANRDLQEEAEKTRRMQLDREAIVEELRKAMLPAPEPEKTATLLDTPMGRILATRDVNGNPVTREVHEISATENMRLQARLDMERETLTLSAQGTQGPLPVDGNTLAMVSKAFFDAFGERANNELLISLLSNHNEARVMKTIPIVAEQHAKKRMSVQSLVTSIRMILESAQSTPVYAAPTPVVQDKYKVLPQIQCPICKEMLPYATAMHCKFILNPRSAQSAGLISAKECQELLEQRGQR